MKNKLYFIIISILLSGLVQANPSCMGAVSGVSIASGGGVYGSVQRGTGVRLIDVVFCNINSSEGNYSGEACKGVLSLLLSASAMKKMRCYGLKKISFQVVQKAG